MSHVYEGPLATYNSLTDRNLSGYFSNTRMRRHLRKAGLVNKRGELVSENQYRLNMARKEHKKHVKDMLAQAIVHKSLDMERTRQVEIRRKLEEIAKIELVRRVRSSRGRKGDEEILPYLSPRSSRSASRPDTANQQRYRPQSAPSGKHYDNDIVYVDEHGRQLSPEGREEFRTTKARPQDIDTKHLYALDSAALRKYALHLSRIEQESMSPYLYSPVPTPPRSQRGNRVRSRPQIRSRPRTAEPHRSSSPREKKSAHSSEKSSERSYSVNSERETSPKGTPARGLRNGQPRRPLNRPRVVEGSLMLHRQEPAMMHQGEVQTLCEITMKYHGPNLTLPRDQYDPTQNVTIDQQHCGGNTLQVFRENLKPGEIFSFISRRHRGYPFSLSIFVDGRVDSRVSTCCEYKHAKGVKLGGKMGHFSLLKVEGATPCYKCKLTTKASPRSQKRPPNYPKRPEQLREEVIVVDRRHVQERYGCDVNKSAEKESPKQKEEVKDEVISPEEAAEYSDDADFDDEEEEKKDEEKGGQEDSSPREICGEDNGEFEGDRAPIYQFGDKKEKEEQIDGNDQTQRTSNKQVRFNEDVKKMGTPESSVSKPGLVNDEDDKAKMEDINPEDIKDKDGNNMVNNVDEGAVDTCDEVSEIETDLESPRKLKENNISKEKPEEELIGDNKTKSYEKNDTASKVLEPDHKHQENASEDNCYSDDFEGSSESTVMSVKCNEKQKVEDNSITQKDNTSLTNAEPKRRGEYYDEAYACDGNKLSQHDETENACMSVNAQIEFDSMSMKSLDEEKKFYIEEDSENEEMKQGPLKTTYEDMNIIGPLATLLMKVRRKKREMQARAMTESESDQDGQKETSEGFGSSSSLEKESVEKLGSQTSLSSLPFENQPNGRKKLEPIMKDKKKRKKKNSVSSSLTDSGRISSETNGRSRKLSDASIKSFDSHRSIEQAIEASQEVVKAVLQSQKQMVISIQQVTESSKLVVNSSKEVLESSKQVNESSKQVNESSKQVNESSKQVVETSQQAISTAMHAIRSIQQAEKEFANVIKYPEAAEKVDITIEADSQTSHLDKPPVESSKAVDSEKSSNNDTDANTNVISSFVDNTNTMNECNDMNSKLERKSSISKDDCTEFSQEDIDCQPDEDKIHSTGDKQFQLVISLLDEISEPDTPHIPTKSNLSELHRSNLFSVQDMDCLPESDDINVCDEVNDIFDLHEKKNMDLVDGEVHTTSEEMHIPHEFQYTDFRTYFDDLEKKSQAEENVISKELSLNSAIRCSEENENAYNLSSPFVRRKSENPNIFDKESMIAKRKRSQSMPETQKKREIEIVKPTTFVYIAKDETLYTETVDVKIRESVTEDISDFPSSAKSSTPRSSELKNTLESNRPSDDSESSILVHKSSEDDILFSDDQQDKISLDTSGEADLLVEGLLHSILDANGQENTSKRNNIQTGGTDESFLNTSREAEIIVEQVLQKVKAGMEESYVGKASETNAIQEDTVSIDTTKEAELIVEDVLQRISLEEAQQLREDENKMNLLKPITPRTDPDGQVTHCVAEETSIVKEHIASIQCNSENLVKSSSNEYDDFPLKRFSADKDDMYSKPRPLKRQEGMQNLFEAVDKEIILETGQNSLVEQNDEDCSLSTSEEASLIVKRVIEGMSYDGSFTTDRCMKIKSEGLNTVNDIETDGQEIKQDSTLENTTNLVLKNTTHDGIPLPSTDFKIDESTTHRSADESKQSSEVEQQDIYEDSEVSNTPNLEPIPIEIDEVRTIECPVVDIEEASITSLEKPRLIKAKSGARVVKYPEQMVNTTQENEIDNLINEEMKILVESGENQDDAKISNNTPCTTVTQGSYVSMCIDEASTAKNKNDMSKDCCQQERTDHTIKNPDERTPKLKDEPVTRAEQVKKEKPKERRDSNVSVSSSSESSETDVKFFMNGEEVKYPKEYQNGKSNDAVPNLLDIDGQIIDLDNLENLDRETYKKVMAVAYNIDVMSTISEEHSTSQSTAHLSNK
uniref:Glutamate-rich protein 3-like isoform X4 n=1 Tax=Crassostrea virginica TaxID=6565 RepID=A0A8B8BN42_CRAVI|nr:glutamate-rich protein 3-like isoform X4 [Crassostrea virginica]